MTAPIYGKTRDGEVLYWPDKSFLSADIPAPLEQYLEWIAKRHPYLGQTPEAIAVHLIRRGFHPVPSQLVAQVVDSVIFFPIESTR